MNWHYVENGQSAGPVSDEQLAELTRSGRINGETLIWREGMANWLPLSQANPTSAPPTIDAGAGSLRISRPAESASPASTGVCAECGKVFPLDEMIRHGSNHICAGCKPVFMQKLAEGATFTTGYLNYASVLTRFAAVFLDGLILWAVGMIMNLMAGFSVAQGLGTQPREMTALPIILIGVQFGMGLAYEVIMIGKYGATLGKMACKIKVVTADGGQVSYARALGRYFAKMVSAFTCLIGYIMAFFDDQKRALHDRICDTRVVTR